MLAKKRGIMTQEIATLTQPEWTTEQIDLIKKTCCNGATDNQLKLFLHTAKKSGLDPLSKQIYAVIYGGTMSIICGIDGYRLIAERSGKYRGQVGPFWCGKDGVWKDVWLDKEKPAACKVGVYHKDFAEPLFSVVKFESYNTNKNLWAKMPETMIAKVAESNALRRAFPNNFLGIYTQEEMDQAFEENTHEIKKIQHNAEIKKIESRKEQTIYITSDEQIQIFQLAKSYHVNFEELQKYLKDKFAVESSRLIKKTDFDKITIWIKSHANKSIAEKISDVFDGEIEMVEEAQNGN